MPQVGDLAINAGSFRRHIHAVGLSPRTEAPVSRIGFSAARLSSRGSHTLVLDA
jgi:hypothetical protein